MVIAAAMRGISGMPCSRLRRRRHHPRNQQEKAGNDLRLILGPKMKMMTMTMIVRVMSTEMVMRERRAVKGISFV
jgi:hypothetical protein